MIRDLLLEAGAMKLFRFFVLLVACAAVSPAIHAQSFPGRSGHWDATVKSAGQESISLNFCMNDDTWKRALNTNKACTISQFSSTLTGASYHVDCNMRSATMKGDTTIHFDGKEHMTSTAKFDMVMNGKPSSFESAVDYRWKAASCTGNEMNLLADKRAKEQQH
jgi:hypothetical protein